MGEKESRQFRDNLIEGLDISFKKLVKEKKKKDAPLAFARKGKVVNVKATELKHE